MADINSIAVVGAGTMGAGIAQLAATRGCSVRLIDINGDVLAQAIDVIGKRLERSVEKDRITTAERDETIHRIKPSNIVRNLSDVDLAIEAVVEDMDIKRDVLAAMEAETSPSTVLATNTSSLSITAIAEAVSDASRVVGMHFFNPAPVMPLVEVIAGRHSAAGNVDRAFSAASAWGKTPVRVKDTPGFIVNRVARGFYLEPLRLLGEGVAGVDEIDAVMRMHARFRMGPFELMDLIGVDVNLAVSTSVWEQFDEHARFTPHPIQRELVEAGYLGRKTGRGFYKYDPDTAPVPAQTVERRSFDMSPLLAGAARMFCTKAGASDANQTEGYVLSRVLAAIMNEAALALSQDVASGADIDTAMIKGTNYPKGPLAWSEEAGLRTVRGTLKALNGVVDDDRFAPAPMFADAD